MSLDFDFGRDLRLKHLFSRAWESFKGRPWLMLSASVVYLLISGLTSSGGEGDGSGLLGLVGLLIAGPLAGGMYLLSLRVARGREAGLGEMFSGFRRFFKLVAVYFLFLLGVLLGLVLLVVPGLIFASGCWPCLLVAMERDDLGAADCLRAAWDMTRGAKWTMFWLMAAVLALNILGLLAFGVGVVLTLPVAFLALASAYDELGREPAA